MLSLLIITIYFISSSNSCSIAAPSTGELYIQTVQLLSEIDYPDQVLLTIQRTSDPYTQSRLTFTDYGPWCKLMNVNTGDVTDVVTCSDYTTALRSYATPYTDSTSVSCDDNCDGTTATCTIIRLKNTYTITDVPYSASSTSCSKDTPPPVGGLSVTFSIGHSIYISFITNMVGIQFDDATSNYQIYTVERVGEWGYLIPGGYGVGTAPSIYSTANVISVAIPCCMCYGSALSVYDISTDSRAMTQVFTLTSIRSDTLIDAVKARGINYGLFYSKTITIYDLSNGKANVFEPYLCDFIAACKKAPCDDSTLICPYNINAKCVDDYCGGCNARWFCGEQDITNWCDSTPISTQICEDPSTITDEPTTTESETTETVTTDAVTESITKETVTKTESETTETVTTDGEPGFCEVSTPETCGGILPIECSDGICVDDPTDDCDPDNGGSDCIGICRPFRWLLLDTVCDFCLCEDGTEEICQGIVNTLGESVQKKFLKACYDYVGDCEFDNVDIINPSDIDKCDCSMFYCASPNCDCPKKSDPYCCKGNDFGNFCEAKCAGYELSECNNNECGNCICTLEYDPYCCDGNKYGNECDAKCDAFDVDTECVALTGRTECIASNGDVSIFGGVSIIAFGFFVALFS